MSINRRQFLERCGISVVAATAAPVLLAAGPASAFDYPERPVRAFLKIHFAASRTFSPRGMDKKERYLTRRFRQSIYKFFERSSKSESTLPLVVDPFTGSQGANEYTVGDAKVRAEKAWVPVTFTDGRNTWSITYVMRNDQERNDDDWRIDDIEDRRGMSLMDLLKKS